MGLEWFDNDELFLRELRTGHRHAEYAAERLRAERIVVHVTPMQVREHVEDRQAFADEHDLTVGLARPCRVDVKSRDLAFTGPDDYPYPTALVDTVAGWDQKRHHPVAIVLVSQHTGGLAVIRVRHASRWIRKKRYDRVRRIHDVFYEVPARELAPFEAFVEWLKARELPTLD